MARKYPDWFYSIIETAFTTHKGNVGLTLADAMPDLLAKAPKDQDFLRQLIEDVARAVVHDLREQHNRKFRSSMTRPPIQPPVIAARSAAVQETANTAQEISGMGYFLSIKGSDLDDDGDDVQHYTREQLDEAYEREYRKAEGCVRRLNVLKALRRRVPAGKTVSDVLSYADFKALVVKAWNAKRINFVVAPKTKTPPALAEAGH